MAYIGRQLARGENKLFDDISSSFNGSTTTFNLTVSSVATATATPYQLFVSLGGVMQKPNTDFTTAGNQITFTTAPAAGLSCWIMMQGDTIDQAAIPDASVTPSKIAGSGDFAFPADIRLKDADGSHYVGFEAPTTVSTNKVWTLPAADGSASTFLQTNGSGVLSWSGIGGAAGIDFNDNVKARFGTGNDLEIFHNASNSVINDAGTGDLLLQVGGTTQATISSTGVVIANDLTVSGTTTTINTQTLDVEDKNVVIGKVSSPSDTTADGGGWTLKGATDKTLNWVNATDAWTSSEHIHLIDNKKLFVGGASGTTDGLEIVHNGSNSIINDSGTGTLQLQLGGSTKLEVTSGGINVTGAISVGGSALASGNTITAVANGSIANNKPVKLDSDGKVAEIKEALLARTDGPKIVGTATGQNFYKDDANSSGCDIRSNYESCNIYDPDTDRVVIVFADGNSAVYSRVGTVNKTTGVITWGNRATVVSGNYKKMQMVYDTINDKVILIINKNSGGAGNEPLTAYVGTVASSGNSMTWSSAVEKSGAETTDVPHCSFDPTTGRVIVCFSKSGGSTYFEIGYINSGSFVWHTGQTANSNNIDHDMYGDSGANSSGHFDVTSIGSSKWLFVSTLWSGAPSGTTQYAVYAKIINAGTSTTAAPTYASTGAIRINPPSLTEGGTQPAAVWDSVKEKLLVTWESSSVSGRSHTGYRVAALCYFDAGKTTITTNDAIYNTNVSGSYASLLYEPESAAFIHVGETTYNDLRVIGIFLTAGGTGNNTLTLSTNNHTARVLDITTANYFGNRQPHDCVDIGGGYLFSYYQDSAVGSSAAGRTLTSISYVKGIQTNLTDPNDYMGFADAAYTNGQTATIKTYGNSVDTLSGLTIGSIYYVQADGTLGTSWDSTNFNYTGTLFTANTPVAGLAISASKLLIRDPLIKL